MLCLIILYIQVICFLDSCLYAGMFIYFLIARHVLKWPTHGQACTLAGESAPAEEIAIEDKISKEM